MRHPTKADIDAIARQTLNWVHAIWKEYGEMEPSLMMLWLGEDEGVVENFEMLPTKLARGFYENAESKDLLMKFVTKILTQPLPAGFRNPDVVAQVNEAWVISNDDARAHNPKDHVSDHPNRKEVISCLFHTAFATSMRVMSIDSETRALSELEAPSPKGHMHGRFQVAEWMNTPEGEPRH